MKVYITKHALTQGIQEKEVRTTAFETLVVSTTNVLESYHKPFWYETKEEAIKHAELLRAKKIISIKKQVKKLEDIKF